MPRSAPSATLDRSTIPVRPAISGQEFLVRQSNGTPRGAVLNPVQKGVAGMGTDRAQADVLALRSVQVPGFLDLEPARDLGTVWGCPDLPTLSSTEMPFSIALMIVVDRISRKWMDDHGVSDADRAALWGSRKNCPNPHALQKPKSGDSAPETYYRARPLERRLGDRAVSS